MNPKKVHLLIYLTILSLVWVSITQVAASSSTKETGPTSDSSSSSSSSSSSENIIDLGKHFFGSDKSPLEQAKSFGTFVGPHGSRRNKLSVSDQLDSNEEKELDAVTQEKLEEFLEQVKLKSGMERFEFEDALAAYASAMQETDKKMKDSEWAWMCLRLGERFERKERLDLAIPHYVAASVARKGWARALNRAGYAYLQSPKHIADAINAFAEAVEMSELKFGPEISESFLGIASIMSMADQPFESIKWCNYAISANQDNVDAWTLIGIQYGKLENFPALISSLNNVLTLEPESPEANYNVAKALLNRVAKDGKSSTKYDKKKVNADAKNAGDKAHANDAEGAATADRNEENSASTKENANTENGEENAGSSQNPAKQLPEDEVVVDDSRARRLFNRTLDLLEAEQLFKNAIAYKSDFADAYLGLAEVYLNTSRIDEAVVVLQMAAEKIPSDYRILYNLGTVLCHKEEDDRMKGIAILEEASSIAVKDADAQIAIALQLYASGASKESIYSAIRRAHALDAERFDDLLTTAKNQFQIKDDTDADTQKIRSGMGSADEEMEEEILADDGDDVDIGNNGKIEL